MNFASTVELSEVQCVTGVHLPSSALVRQATEFVRDTESELLFNHSSRVFCFAAFSGVKRGLAFDPELLYVGAMLHDIGLAPQYSSLSDRFEVDGANEARKFLKGRGIAQEDIDRVWTAIALHTTPGIPQYMHRLIALVTARVELDVLGISVSDLDETVRLCALESFPRTEHFKEDIIQAFYDGIRRKPETTFGNIKADVLADQDPQFKRINFCSIIRGSPWKG